MAAQGRAAPPALRDLMAVSGRVLLLAIIVSTAVVGGLLVMALMRTSAHDDREPEQLREYLDDVDAAIKEHELALRVRRASPRWPLSELDPIERATFAGAVAQARAFDDLDVHWQELIIAAERGSRSQVVTLRDPEPQRPDSRQ